MPSSDGDCHPHRTHRSLTTGALSAASLTATTGPSSFTGGIDNKNGGISNVGALTGVTELTTGPVTASSVNAGPGAFLGRLDVANGPLVVAGSYGAFEVQVNNTGAGFAYLWGGVYGQNVKFFADITNGHVLIDGTLVVTGAVVGQLFSVAAPTILQHSLTMPADASVNIGSDRVLYIPNTQVFVVGRPGAGDFRVRTDTGDVYITRNLFVGQFQFNADTNELAGGSNNEAKLRLNGNTGDITASGNIRSTGGSVIASGSVDVGGKIQEKGNDLIPAGMIMLWNPSFGAIPAGWAEYSFTVGPNDYGWKYVYKTNL